MQRRSTEVVWRTSGCKKCWTNTTKRGKVGGRTGQDCFPDVKHDTCGVELSDSGVQHSRVLGLGLEFTGVDSISHS